MGRQFLEEAASVAEEHGNLVKDHLVEQSGAQRSRDDTAAHDRDVPIASSGASALDAGFDGSDEGLLVGRLGWRRAVADHDERSRRVRARPSEAIGVVVRVAARDDSTDPPREVVEDGATRLEQPEAGEQLARGVAVAVPVEEDATVTESVAGTGRASGDEAVDGDGQ